MSNLFRFLWERRWLCPCPGPTRHRHPVADARFRTKCLSNWVQQQGPGTESLLNAWGRRTQKLDN